MQNELNEASKPTLDISELSSARDKIRLLEEELEAQTRNSNHIIQVIFETVSLTVI